MHCAQVVCNQFSGKPPTSVPNKLLTSTQMIHIIRKKAKAWVNCMVCLLATHEKKNLSVATQFKFSPHSSKCHFLCNNNNKKTCLHLRKKEMLWTWCMTKYCHFVLVGFYNFFYILPVSNHEVTLSLNYEIIIPYNIFDSQPILLKSQKCKTCFDQEQTSMNEIKATDSKSTCTSALSKHISTF